VIQTLCQTLLLPIYNEEDSGPGGKSLEPIKSVKDFPQDSIELDTYDVISNTWSLNKIMGTDENGVPTKQCPTYVLMKPHTKFEINYILDLITGKPTKRDIRVQP